MENTVVPGHPSSRLAAIAHEGIRLLLVEDIADHAELISTIITSRDPSIELDTATSVDDALDAVEDRAYDILLTDYRIGNIECFDLLDHLRSRDQELPTIILTGQGNESVAAEAIGEGAEDYLIKDLVFDNPDQLIRSIRRTVEKTRLEKALSESEELYRTLVQNIHDGVFVLRDTRLVFFNPSFTRILETEAGNIGGINFVELFVLAQRPAVVEFVSKALISDDAVESEFTMIGTDHKPEIFVNISLTTCLYGGEPALIGTVKDVTSRVLADRKLQEMLEEKEQLSITDELTGLSNRRYAMQFLESEITRARRYGTTLSLLMMDLDRFKAINDSYGHLFGDDALAQVADVLKQEVREADMVARYGGDEFILILPETTLEQAHRLAERIRTRVRSRRMRVSDEVAFQPSVSIGLAEFDSDHDTITTLIKRADDGLLSAKNAGRDAIGSITASAEASLKPSPETGDGSR